MGDLPAVMLLGVASGLQASLLAVGIVLIYRSGRFINFAQGEMGAVGAAFAAVLIFEFDLPYPVAVASALAFGGALGAGIERLLSSRLFEAPRLSLMVATIGIAQLCLLATLVGPLKIDARKLNLEGYPEPFDFTWKVGALTLTSSQVTTIIVGPLIAIGLYLVLNNTKLGKAIRGAASNPDAARLAGVSVRRVNTLVWAIAGVVSALAAILFSPTQPPVSVAAAGSALLLLRGLTAAVIAGMSDFRIAFGAGIVMGIAEQSAIFYTDVPGLAVIAVLTFLVGGLVVRARALTMDANPDDDLVTESSTEPLPERVQDSAVLRYRGRIGWFLLIGIVAMAPLMPGLQTQERATFLLFMLSFAMVGIGLSVLTGWAGLLSLGQFAIMGCGAYAAAYFDRRGSALLVLLIGGGLVGAAVSATVGLAAVRFRGVFLGVVTLGFAFVARDWLFRQTWVTEDSGGIVSIGSPHFFGIEIRTVRTSYAVGVIVLILTVLALRYIRSTGIGRAIVGVRDNDDLASSYGMTPVSIKLAALGISGFVSGMAGALWGMASGTWGFSTIEPSMGFVLLSVVIVGGLGTLHGPILGVIAVFGWPYLVTDANTLPIRTFTSGVLLLITLLFFPGGIAALLRRGQEIVINLFAKSAPPEFGPEPEARPLVVENLSISFGGIHAVDDASLHVDRGEIVGLIGGNGAGKSTLLNCVSGHLSPDHGQIYVAGQDVRHLGPEFRPFLGLSRTFQNARLFPGLTVEETILAAVDRTSRTGILGALFAAPWTRAGERDKRERALVVMDNFGLTEHRHKLTGELSTGMRRICDIAAVVVTEPAIVLLDEPTAGLAQREVEAFAPRLRALRDTYGCSVLIVEHDMPLMMALSDRIYCLENGSVIAHGAPDEVRDDPRVIASYLGSDSSAIERSTGTSSAAPAAAPENGQDSTQIIDELDESAATDDHTLVPGTPPSSESTSGARPQRRHRRAQLRA